MGGKQPLIPLSPSLLPTGPKIGIRGKTRWAELKASDRHCATRLTGGRREGASRLWQEGPRNPGTHTQLPFSGMQVPPFLQVQVLLQLAPQKPSGQGRWQRVPVGERNRVSLACPTPSIRVLLDTFLGVYWYTPNSTMGVVPGHPECSPVQPAWHWHCP